jgi:hypothetical protein
MAENQACTVIDNTYHYLTASDRRQVGALALLMQDSGSIRKVSRNGTATENRSCSITSSNWLRRSSIEDAFPHKGRSDDDGR